MVSLGSTFYGAAAEYTVYSWGLNPPVANKENEPLLNFSRLLRSSHQGKIDITLRGYQFFALLIGIAREYIMFKGKSSN